MDGTGRSTTVHQCGSCGNFGLGTGEITCCGRSMQPVRTEPSDGTHPALEDLARVVFDVSGTELDLCLCVMEGGEQTVADLAERTGYDRSVVSRHLCHLADVGVIERRRRLLEQGGQVYVYSPREPDAVRESFRRAFLAWVARADALVDDLSREKVEAIVESEADEARWKIYQE